MQNKSLNNFWRQEVLLICVELSKEVNLETTVTFFVRKLGELHKEHEAQER